MFDMIKQQLECGKINHLLSGLIGDFIVSCKPAESVQPGKCAFHHPPKRFWRESVCSVGSGTDLDVDIEISLYILNKLTAISTVNKSFPDRRPCIRNLFTHRRCESGIMYPGTADVSAEDEAVAVNSNIAFYAFYLFIGIEPVVALTVAPLDTLGVKRHDRRCGGLSTFAAYLHDEFFYAVAQIAVCPPFVEVPIDRLPFWKIVRKHAPLASADQKIQYCLEYGTQGIFAVSAIIFKEYFVYIRPLTLGQMCLIEADFMHTNRFSSTNTLIEGLLCHLMFNLV